MKFGLALLALASLALAVPAPDTADTLDIRTPDDGLEMRAVDEALEARSPDGDDDDDEGDVREPPSERDLAKRAPLRVMVHSSNVRCRSGTSTSSRVEFFVQRGQVYTSTCWAPGTRVGTSSTWWRLANVGASGNSCYVHNSLIWKVSGSGVGRC